MFVDRNLPQTQLDTSAYCDQSKEIIAVKVLVAERKINLISVYYRPGGRGGHDLDWVRDLNEALKGESIVIGGDFNSAHTMWNYSKDSRRGKNIVNAMTTARLDLLNEAGTFTRVATHFK